MCESENQGSNNINENQSEMLLTVKEVAHHINESPHVIRNWMRELKGHVPTHKGDNNYHYFNKISIERLLLIKKLSREQGYSLRQIQHYLATGEDPLDPEIKSDNQDMILQELKEIKEDLKNQKQFNQALIHKLDEQNQYINDSINRRDQQLMKTLQEMQQARIEASATNEKKGFWRRIFK
ncbi:MAG: MerR family transcriptional regulator [Bacillota bacterium]